MPRRVVIAVLAPPAWTPPGLDPARWRLALAEDIADVLALLTEAEPALAIPAADESLRADVGWPGLRTYLVPELAITTVLAAAAADGFEQAAVVAADAPDLPGMVIAKLLRPLTSRPVAAAGVTGADRGLIGLGATLPAPPWLPALPLDDLTPADLRRHAPAVTDVAPAIGWHRLRGPQDLGRLDLRLEGWEATRALLSGAAR